MTKKYLWSLDGDFHTLIETDENELTEADVDEHIKKFDLYDEVLELDYDLEWKPPELIETRIVEE